LSALVVQELQQEDSMEVAVLDIRLVEPEGLVVVSAPVVLDLQLVEPAGLAEASAPVAQVSQLAEQVELVVVRAVAD